MSKAFVPLETPHYIDVLQLYANGRCYKEISTELQINVRTVESICQRLKAALGATCMAHAVAIAIRTKLIN